MRKTSGAATVYNYLQLYHIVPCANAFDRIEMNVIQKAVIK